MLIQFLFCICQGIFAGIKIMMIVMFAKIKGGFVKTVFRPVEIRSIVKRTVSGSRAGLFFTETDIQINPNPNRLTV